MPLDYSLRSQCDPVYDRLSSLLPLFGAAQFWRLPFTLCPATTHRVRRDNNNQRTYCSTLFTLITTKDPLSMTQRTVSIQIPLDATPGDMLSFVVGGNELELTIPEGSLPGDVLEIQLAKDETGENNDDKEETDIITRVPLDDDKTLVLHHFVPADNHSGNDETDIADDYDDDGTHAMAWPAGLELAKFICFEKQNAQIISSVLELGSGLGVVGLALAAKLSTTTTCSKTRTIVLTDVSSAMPLLNYNVQQNQHLIPSNVTVQTREFNWENDANAAAYVNNKYDLIVGSDLLYNTCMIPSLVATLQRCMSSRVLIGVRWRKPDLERCFFQDTSNFVDWTLVESSSKCCCSLSWKEYGNPTKVVSNQYFRQTMVAVRGTLKSLAEISESDINDMTEQEYYQWEQTQIQIYEGVRRKNNLASPSSSSPDE